MTVQAEVQPIDFTGNEKDWPAIYAAAMLIFTKSTRLKMTGDGFQNIYDRCLGDQQFMMSELDYMSKTIPSSWEFVDFTFLISNVSRACAQQITRTRTASFAMQSQRVTDLRDVSWHNPIDDWSMNHSAYNDAISAQIEQYSGFISKGVSQQDARGLLPINVHCNLVAKYNLRTIADLVLSRDNSERVQDEYFQVVQQIKKIVLDIYPWSELFFRPRNEKAIELLNEFIEDSAECLGHEQRIKIAKAIDLIKKG